jgi:hypothetical protein
MGGISSTPSWATLSGKPSTVSGYNITDFGTQVASNVAGVGLGGVGSYALCFNYGTAGAGATKAGSTIRYCDVPNNSIGGTPSGTWRVMGYAGDGQVTVFQRIS